MRLLMSRSGSERTSGGVEWIRLLREAAICLSSSAASFRSTVDILLSPLLLCVFSCNPKFLCWMTIRLFLRQGTKSCQTCA